MHQRHQDALLSFSFTSWGEEGQRNRGAIIFFDRCLEDEYKAASTDKGRTFFQALSTSYMVYGMICSSLEKRLGAFDCASAEKMDNITIVFRVLFSKLKSVSSANCQDSILI